MRQLSILYTTFNEADILPRSLAAISGLSDDLVVIDSFSTDGTRELLAAHPEVRLLERAYEGPADQKNWGLAQVRHDYVLLLDADEVVRPELRAEIEALLAAPEEPKQAYWIGRDNHFMGRRIAHSGWAGERVVRLVDRRVARYDDRQVHEEIVLEGLNVGRLRGRMDHYLFNHLDHFWDKNRRYARWSARDREGKTGRIGIYHLLVKPVWRFLKHYVVQGGFRDGREGLIISMIIGYSVFQRYAYLLEARRRRKV